MLRDADLAGQLEASGHTRTSLLPSEVVVELLRAVEQFAPAEPGALEIDYARADRTAMRRLDQLLAPVWAAYLPRLFVAPRPVLTTLVVKHPGDASFMFLHDDRSFVDESLARSVTLWIPLVDVAPELRNGCLEVVPRSHELDTGLSGTGTPDLIRPYEDRLRSLLVPISAAAGDAVVYDSRLLHASGPNLSDRARPAIVCAVAPAEAELIHVVATGRRTRELHLVDEAFFVEHGPRELEAGMPSAQRLLRRVHDDRRLDPVQLQEVLGGPAPDPVPPVPHDVRSDWRVAVSSVLPCRRSGAEPRRTDLDATAALELSDDADAPAVLERSGHVVCLCAATAARVMDAPADASDTATVLVAGVGARVRLDVAGPGRWQLHVLECPTVGAGIAGDAGVGAFDLEDVFEVAPGEVVLWNDGPGVLVLVLTALSDHEPVAHSDDQGARPRRWWRRR